MATLADFIFIDSNILIYALDRDSIFHPKAKEIFDRIDIAERNACLSPQVLSECYAIITNPKITPRPLSVKEAISVIERILLADTILKIYPKETTCKLAFNLAKKYNLKSQTIFDAQLVATMLDNGIKNIYTVNEKDFRKFKEIRPINPFV